MNLLDLLLILLVGVSVIVGFRRGAAMQAVAYAGLFIGLVLGALLAPRVADLASGPFVQAALALATLLGVAALFDALGWVIGARARVAARTGPLGTTDAWAGSILAAVASLLAVWFLAFNLVQGPFPALSGQIRGSAIVRGIDAVLPRPPSVLAQVRGFLDRFGFPEVFAGLPPAPAGPVEGPTRGEVGRAVRAADQSTMRIVGRACDRIQEGTGFLAAHGYVVTNAHVVAGVAQPEAQVLGGDSHPATPVLFDPDLDLAVLRIEVPAPEPLPLLDRDLSRGDVGAVLGYPGGGSLRAGPAGVRRVLDAVGRDIYGRRTVQREVYELQAVARPGSSGGPFVTEDGSVAGVVFAASTTDPGVAYALTSSEVMPRVDRAVSRSRPVGTGPCLR